MSYTNVFSEDSLPPSDVGLAIYSITSNATFSWPSYVSPDSLTLASIVELSGTDDFSLTLPPAEQVSVGEPVLFLNTGTTTFSIKDQLGIEVLSLVPGASYLVYVKDNTTAAGVWGSIAYGAGVSEATAGSLAGNGLKALSNKLAAEVTAVTLNSDYTLLDANRAKVLLFTGGATTLTLAAINTLSNNFFCHVKNNGTGTLTLSPSGGNLIDGANSLTVQPAESCIIMNDNANSWVTVGLGRSTLYQYSNLTLDVSAGGTFTLTSAQAANKLLTFTGNPAAGVTVVVPAIVSIYYVANNLSTPYAVQIKTAGDAGTLVDQSQRAVILCDGASVTSAQTAPTTSVQSLLDGTVTAPSLNFASKTNTGLYKYSTQGMGLTVNGVAQLTTNGSGVTFPQGIESPLFLNTPSSTRNYNVTQSYGALQVGGVDAFRFGGDTSGQLDGFRNKLINGNFRIAQRGASVTAVAGATTYVLDRWAVFCTGANIVTQKFGASAGNMVLQLNGAVGNTVLNVVQRIEAVNSYFLSGAKITVSALVTSPNARNITLSLSTPATSDVFGVSMTTVGSQVVPVVAGQNEVKVTFTLGQNVINGLELGFILGATTSGVFYLSKVQLEEGSIATPFENRPIGLELALCQRYCLPFSYGHDFYAPVTAQIDRITYQIPEMRVAPTVGALSNSNSTNTISIVVSPVTARSVQLQIQGSAIGNVGATGSCLLTAEL